MQYCPESDQELAQAHTRDSRSNQEQLWLDDMAIWTKCSTCHIVSGAQPPSILGSRGMLFYLPRQGARIPGETVGFSNQPGGDSTFDITCAGVRAGEGRDAGGILAVDSNDPAEFFK